MQGRRRESSGQPARLPVIAPRQDSETHQVRERTPDPVNTEVRKNRLPPRSRSGCWTCRTRKVKCDEQRPACGQCVRLGHTCDYSPRLSFKDDTPRIVDRMQQDVSVVGNSIWDPGVGTYHRDTRPATEEDSLPPFSYLTTDEDREKKAEAREPGSFFVLTNPSSFASLPEYQDEKSTSQEPFPTGLDNQQSVFNGQFEETNDADIVFLKHFEIPIRRGSMQISPRPVFYSSSPGSYTEPQSRRPSQAVVHNGPQNVGAQPLSMLDTARNGGRDAELLRHYRTVISPLLSRMEQSIDEEDIFEAQARIYPALYHAIMALSSLSMAYKNNIQSADALEHYQQVIPALKTTVQSTEDSYSDGALLSHYILLLYEISTAGSCESNMWQHHSDQLLRIIIGRKQAQSVEPYDFLVWSIFSIDIYALLSTTGSGTFAQAMLENNMLPTPERHVSPIALGVPHTFPPDEQIYFPELQQLNQQVLLLAAQIGQMARSFRSEARRILSDPTQFALETEYFSNCRMRVQALHEVIEDTRQSWRVQFPNYWIWLNTLGSLPPRVFAWVQHVYLLFRACLIYADTSMYPGQIRDPGFSFNVQVTRWSKEILQAASLLLSQERYEVRFIVFPLFLAGVFAANQGDKETALNLIAAVEPHSFGGSIQSVRVVLQAVYNKQLEARLQTGDANSVDWVEEMELSGQGLIITGL